VLNPKKPPAAASIEKPTPKPIKKEKEVEKEIKLEDYILSREVLPEANEG